MQGEDIEDDSFTKKFVKPSLTIGALGGISGFLIGGTIGLYRSKTPRLYATASAIQCFTVGTTFWATRAALLHGRTFHSSPSTTFDSNPDVKLKASTAASCLTGSSLGLLYRGPRGIIPGAIIITLLGASGQQLYNVIDRRHTSLVLAEKEKIRKQKAGEEEEVRHWGWRGFVEWMATKKWSPIKKLSNAEYEAMLQEKIVGVEADLALIDEEMEKVRREAALSSNEGEARTQE